MAGRRQKRPLQRRQEAEVAGDEDDGDQRRHQGLQPGGMAPPRHGGGPGRVARAWEGLESRRRPKGIAGELELGDGGPWPARPGYGFLRDCGVCGRSRLCSRRLGRALFIAEPREGIGLRRRTPGHGARRQMASVSEGEGDAAHAGTVGEWRRAQGREGGDEHSAHHTVALAGPRPCWLRRAPASVSARRELRRSRR